MSEADRVLRRKFEISAATPNNSHISLAHTSPILEKPTAAEEQNELEETAEKQQGEATEVQEKLSTSQKADKDPKVPAEEPEEDCESAEGFQSPESSGDTEVLTFSPPCVIRDQQKLSQWEESGDSEEESRPQEGCGDSEDLSCPSSFLSCSSYEHLRKSILRRERHTSTINLRTLDYAQDLEATFSGPRLSSSSSTGSVMKGRSLSLTPNSSDAAMGFEIKNSCWPYFRRSDIDAALSVFKQVDEDKNGFISLCELKRFLEILQMPQTHLKTKKMMAQVVRGSEDRLNFSEALLIYGTLKQRLVPLKWRLQTLEKSQFVITDEVDVAQVGVSGAKLFFEAKIALQTPRYPKEMAKSGPEVPKKPQSEP